jgi:hypothetical protein
VPDYPHFIPILNPAPPPGYRLDQVLPLDRFNDVLDHASATIDVERLVFLEGKKLISDTKSLRLQDGVWENPEAAHFSLDPIEGTDWANGSPLAFMQTSVTIRDARTSALIAPGFYTIYSGPDRKSFLSDSSLKMAHPAVIKQVATYGKWAEGYPACVVDPKIDAGESLVLINPYERPAVAAIEIEGQTSARFKVLPLHSRRVDIRECLDESSLPWRGQIYVTGPRRLVAFFINHSLKDPAHVVNMEHTDPYRGETLWSPLSRALHWKYKSKLGLTLR